MRALHTAATGMMAQELNVQVISNNIANMRTTGYKRQRGNSRTCCTSTSAASARRLRHRATSCRSASTLAEA